MLSILSNKKKALKKQKKLETIKNLKRGTIKKMKSDMKKLKDSTSARDIIDQMKNQTQRNSELVNIKRFIDLNDLGASKLSNDNVVEQK